MVVHGASPSAVAKSVLLRLDHMDRPGHSMYMKATLCKAPGIGLTCLGGKGMKKDRHMLCDIVIAF